jgi:ubiquinone/menaquinone biosynthesis C-methylase UbiE
MFAIPHRLAIGIHAYKESPNLMNDPYRNFARFYDRLFEPLNRSLRLLGLKMFPPVEGMRVLDAGCGTGAHLEIYRQTGCALFGIDTSPSMLKIARMRLGGKADLHMGNAAEMPYRDETFDLAISMLTLHEMAHSIRKGVIREINRVLKENGRILLIDFHPGPIQPIQGWLTKPIILLAEMAAGRKHFRNYRHFMSIKGLPTLVGQNLWKIEKQKIVGGGTLALFLLRKGPME